jgi:hypothetical protein
MKTLLSQQHKRVRRVNNNADQLHMILAGIYSGKPVHIGQQQPWVSSRDG